jgi:hypothetical protein
MISFSNINKQYGKQLIFVEASFPVEPWRRLVWSAPTVRAKQRCSAWLWERRLPTRRDFGSEEIERGYFRQDVEEMKGRSVIDEAIPAAAVWVICTMSWKISIGRWKTLNKQTTWTKSSNALVMSRKV